MLPPDPQHVLVARLTKFLLPGSQRALLDHVTIILPPIWTGTHDISYFSFSSVPFIIAL